MKFHLVLQSIRNAKSYIQNRSPTAKQIKIRQKILHESLKIGRTNATAAREGQIQTKYNKFGLKLTNKQVDHSEQLLPKWKNLKQSDRGIIPKILGSIGQEKVTIKSRKLFSLDGQLSGDSIYGAARMKNLEHTISKNILLDASKEKSKIDKELKGVRSVLDSLLENCPKEFQIPVDEFHILGLQKLRRDLILVRLVSDKPKKRKEQILNILGKNFIYFNGPVSNYVTENTLGRKHRAKVVFDWAKVDISEMPDESLLAKGHTLEEHEEAIKILSEKSREEREQKRLSSLNYELEHGLISSPEKQVFRMKKVELGGESSYLHPLEVSDISDSVETLKFGIDNDYLLKRIADDLLSDKEWVLKFEARFDRVEDLAFKDLSFNNVIHLGSKNRRNSIEIEE